MTLETVFKQDEALALFTEAKEQPRFDPRLLTLVQYAAGGCALYGFTMGLNHSFPQAFASAGKVFLLFTLTLAICVPTLHFIGLLFGSALRLGQSLTVLMAGISLTSILLGAFAPISLFFLWSGSSYEFLLLFHVGVFAFCGGAGLFSIKRNLNRLFDLESQQGNARPSSFLLNIWFLLYMFIGAQMSYVLSPFVGKSNDFMLFTSDKGDFFSYLMRTLRDFIF